MRSGISGFLILAAATVLPLRGSAVQVTTDSFVTLDTGSVLEIEFRARNFQKATGALPSRIAVSFTTQALCGSGPLFDGGLYDSSGTELVWLGGMGLQPGEIKAAWYEGPV